MSSVKSFFKYGLLFTCSATLAFFALAYFLPTPSAYATMTVSKVVYLTSGTSWVVPGDFTPANNTVECIGGGGGGSTSGATYGSGGGAYAKSVNLNVSGTVTYQIGAGGALGAAGGDTWFNSASFPASGQACGAKGGGVGTNLAGTGLGGTAAASYSTGTGALKYNGGNGGATGNESDQYTYAGGGGGGAGGPSGNGATGANALVLGAHRGGSGGNGDAGLGGVGGVGGTGGNGGSGGVVGGTGGTGAEWDSTHGAGGGGGGSGTRSGQASFGGGPGTYGGGGGGGATANGGNYNPGGVGGAGIIVITYGAFPLTVSIAAPANSGNVCLTGTPGAFVVTRNGPGTYPAVTVTLSYSGSAVGGVDYVDTLPTSVIIPANQTSVSVPVTALAKTSGSVNNIVATVVGTSNYDPAAPTSATMTINNVSAPQLETVSGYTSSAPFTTWPYPTCASQNFNLCTFSGVADNPTSPNQLFPPTAGAVIASSTWYVGTPSPLTCEHADQGSCLYIYDKKGARISSITAAPQFSLTNTSALQSNLVGFWSFDSGDVSGSTVNDVSGQGNNGTLVNTPSAANGHYTDANNARTFNGTTQYVSFLYNSAFNPTGDYSISVWVNPTTVAGGRGIFSRDAPSSVGPYLIYQNGATYQFYASSNGASWNIANAQSFGAATAGTWTHLVVVRSGNTYILYRNGAQALTWSDAQVPFASPYPLVIGRQYPAGAYFGGSIDEAMYYNRALSASEVTQVYNLTAPAATALHIATISSASGGLDLVSSVKTNPCGGVTSHWSYVASPAASLLVPKYTPVQITYACQPNQSYYFSTFRNYGGSASASTIQQRTFRFADRAKVNGSSVPNLYGTQSTTVSGNSTTFSLECGGYMPEEGTTVGLRPGWTSTELAAGGAGGWTTGLVDDFNFGPDNQHYFTESMFEHLSTTVGLPQFYSPGFQPACWSFCYWPWTWAFYGTTSPTYYQPAATVQIQTCSDPNAIVTNVAGTPTCTPCPGGQYRSGNQCIGSAPPTATINAGAGNGVIKSVSVGTPVTVTAAYAVDPTISTRTVAFNNTPSGGTWTVPAGVTSVDYIVVGGGGGGGGYISGGGGGGGVRTGTLSVTAGTPLTLTVGAGGSAGTGSGIGTNGTASTFGSITAAGGGSGGPGEAGTTGNGGSGGGTGRKGGGRGGVAGIGNTPVVSPSQGNNGGTGSATGGTDNLGSGAGGGGANAVGGNATVSVAGNGGAGVVSSISGSAVTYGGGGGGGAYNGTGGTGGAGGGGAGANGSGGVPGAGIANTGGGGGGGGYPTNQTGGAGGSGVVILSYLGPADTLTATAINDDTGASSNQTKTITATGNAQVDTAQSKFGGASGLFDGTGDYISSPDNTDFEMGSGDFTIDFWIRPNNTTGTADVLGKRANSGAYGPYMFYWASGNIYIFMSTTGTSWDQASGLLIGALPASTWSHVAIVRSGSLYYRFLNGALVGSAFAASGSLVDNSEPLRIGGGTDNSLNGWMDEVRVSKGIARWTSSFTPPSSAYTNDTSTVLLTHMDGADASTVFTDEGSVSNNSSVDCNYIVGNVSGTHAANCWTLPDSTKTYTLPASTINTPGLYTYSAQIKTTSYLNYNSYGSVQVRVCPIGQGSDGSGGCQNIDQCTDINNTPNGPQYTIPTGCQTPVPIPGICIPSGYFFDYAANQCRIIPAVPTLNTNSFTATRVRAGNPATLSWSIPGMAAGITCSISPIPASGTNTDGTLVWNGSSNPFTGTAQTAPITQATKYTLTCVNNQDPSAVKSVIVNILPTFKEN